MRVLRVRCKARWWWWFMHSEKMTVCVLDSKMDFLTSVVTLIPCPSVLLFLLKTCSDLTPTAPGVNPWLLPDQIILECHEDISDFDWLKKLRSNKRDDDDACTTKSRRRPPFGNNGNDLSAGFFCSEWRWVGRGSGSHWHCCNRLNLNRYFIDQLASNVLYKFQNLISELLL